MHRDQEVSPTGVCIKPPEVSPIPARKTNAYQKNNKKRDFFATLVYTILKHDEIEAKRNARAK